MKLKTKTFNQQLELLSHSYAKRAFWIAFRTVLLAGISFIIIFPIIMKASTSLKSVEDLYNPTVFLFPASVTFQYFKDVLNFVNYNESFFRSIFFTLGNSLLQVGSCVLVAYGVGRFQYKGRGLVMGAVLMTLIIPTQTILMPLFLQFKNFSFMNLFTLTSQGRGIDLINTPWPFVLLSMSALGIRNGIFIFILSQFFRNLPNVLEEAAYIDGCGIFKTFFRIMLPTATTILVTIFLFSFVWIWNDNYYTAFFGAEMEILSSQFTGIGAKLTALMGEKGNLLLASIYNNTAVIIHMIPIIILYIFAQKYFVQGVEKSGIVG